MVQEEKSRLNFIYTELFFLEAYSCILPKELERSRLKFPFKWKKKNRG